MAGCYSEVNCDPNCVWRDGLAELEIRRAGERAELPRDETEPQDGMGNHPLTADGYKGLGDIESRYRGLNLLGQVGSQGCFEPCYVADYVEARLPDPTEQYPILVFGSEVSSLVTSIKGA